MIPVDLKQLAPREFLSPLNVILLAANGVCFGGCLVMLLLGHINIPLILLTLGTGLSFGALTLGAYLCARKETQHKQD